MGDMTSLGRSHGASLCPWFVPGTCLPAHCSQDLLSHLLYLSFFSALPPKGTLSILDSSIILKQRNKNSQFLLKAVFKLCSTKALSEGALQSLQEKSVLKIQFCSYQYRNRRRTQCNAA